MPDKNRHVQARVTAVTLKDYDLGTVEEVRGIITNNEV